MMGDRGEQFTASELRRLTRRGWRVINHIALKRHSTLDAEEIVREAMRVAAGLCIYTNDHLVLESLGEVPAGGTS